MAKRIAHFGGSLNPPTEAHVQLVENALAAGFDLVVVTPCGLRPDKVVTNDILPLHRAIMADIAFRRFGDRVLIDLSDLDRGEFTRTWDLDQKWRTQGDIWHVIGYDLIRPENPADKGIHGWHRAEELWRECNFAVAPRGKPMDPACLPPNCLVLPETLPIASSQVRNLVNQRGDYESYVPPAIAAYIKRHQLYLGHVPPAKVPFGHDRLVPRVIADPNKPEALELADRITAAYGTDDAPNCLVGLGGDGFFMEMLRANWRGRLPFLGLNMGHAGHFMNQLTEGADPLETLRRDDLVVRQSPILHVEWEDESGERHVELGVNDAWLERDTGQSAWIKLDVNGVTRINKVSGDGVLVGSSLGSTGYAYNLGATPLFDQPGLILAGIVPSRFLHWDPVTEGPEVVVHIEALDIGKRPVMAMIDSVERGRARWMTVRSSRIAAVELVFTPEDDLEQKRLRFQYPST